MEQAHANLTFAVSCLETPIEYIMGVQSTMIFI